jgi:hypothetical protein
MKYLNLNYLRSILSGKKTLITRLDHLLRHYGDFRSILRKGNYLIRFDLPASDILDHRLYLAGVLEAHRNNSNPRHVLGKAISNYFCFCIEADGDETKLIREWIIKAKKVVVLYDTEKRKESYEYNSVMMDIENIVTMLEESRSSIFK